MLFLVAVTPRIRCPFENWESEFLQMAVLVFLTTVLIQKESPESRRPGVRELVDTDPCDFADDADAPWPVRHGGWILRVYEHSLGLAFVLLFLIALVGHAIGVAVPGLRVAIQVPW